MSVKNYERVLTDKQSLKDAQVEWRKAHPEYLTCVDCGTIIHVNLAVSERCPDCHQWQRQNA
jgi:Zn finger protein HypA/HybF involved in hydrogenase expression